MAFCASCFSVFGRRKTQKKISRLSFEISHLTRSKASLLGEIVSFIVSDLYTARQLLLQHENNDFNNVQ